MLENPIKKPEKKQEDLSSRMRAFQEIHKLSQMIGMEGATDKFFDICDINDRPRFFRSRLYPRLCIC